MQRYPDTKIDLLIEFYLLNIFINTESNKVKYSQYLEILSGFVADRVDRPIIHPTISPSVTVPCSPLLLGADQKYFSSTKWEGKNMKRHQKYFPSTKWGGKYESAPRPDALELLLEAVEHVVPRVWHQKVFDASLQAQVVKVKRNSKTKQAGPWLLSSYCLVPWCSKLNLTLSIIYEIFMAHSHFATTLFVSHLKNFAVGRS